MVKDEASLTTNEKYWIWALVNDHYTDNHHLSDEDWNKQFCFSKSGVRELILKLAKWRID